MFRTGQAESGEWDTGEALLGECVTVPALLASPVPQSSQCLSGELQVGGSS